MLHNPRRPDPLLQLCESSRVLHTPWALKDKPGPSEATLPHCSRVPRPGERGFSASRPLALVELCDPSAASSTPSLHIAEGKVSSAAASHPANTGPDSGLTGHYSAVREFIVSFPLVSLAVKIKKPIKTKFRMPVFNWVALKPNQINGTVFNEIDDERILEVRVLSADFCFPLLSIPSVSIGFCGERFWQTAHQWPVVPCKESL